MQQLPPFTNENDNKNKTVPVTNKNQYEEDEISIYPNKIKDLSSP
jgi:hypothetical protein